MNQDPQPTARPPRNGDRADAFVAPRRRRRRRALPGLPLALGCTLTYLSLIVLLPLATLLYKSGSLGADTFWQIVSSPRAVATYKVTVGAALLATVFNAVTGLLLAWVLVRYRFPGRRLLDALVDLPFALPTAVAGITLTALFAADGWLGAPLAALGVQVVYTPLGIAVAMAFTSTPFVIRSVQPVLESVDPAVESAAQVLGATAAQTFLRVVFPVILPAFIAGCAMAFARSLGEFGAVIFIAGNLPFETEITSLLTYIRLEEFDYPAASAYATVLLLVSFALLFIANLVQVWLLRYTRSHA